MPDGDQDAHLQTIRHQTLAISDRSQWIGFEVETCSCLPEKKRTALAQVRWQVNRVLPQLAYFVSKTAQIPETEQSATYDRELNKLVSKGEVSSPALIFRLVCLEEVVVVTAFDASFAKECFTVLSSTESTLAAESTALASAVHCQLYVRLPVEA